MIALAIVPAAVFFGACAASAIAGGLVLRFQNRVRPAPLLRPTKPPRSNCRVLPYCMEDRLDPDRSAP